MNRRPHRLKLLLAKPAGPAEGVYPGAPMDKTPEERQAWRCEQRERSRYLPHILERVVRVRKVRRRAQRRLKQARKAEVHRLRRRFAKRRA